MKMYKSNEISELAKALAAAQGELENASKNAANPHFKSKYADLAEVLNTDLEHILSNLPDLRVGRILRE